MCALHFFIVSNLFIYFGVCLIRVDVKPKSLNPFSDDEDEEEELEEKPKLKRIEGSKKDSPEDYAGKNPFSSDEDEEEDKNNKMDNPM